MATLTITIPKAAVVEAVKGDTYITSSVDRGADSVKNARVAYNEAAGNDSHHEKKIERLIKGAVSKFAAEIAEFCDSAAGAIRIAIGTDIVITMTVIDRYNAGLADPISGIASEYIINMAIYGWWVSIKPDFAKGFAGLATDALVYARKCFAKTAPTATASTTSATGSVA